MGIIRKIVHFLAIICYILIFAYALICVPMIFGYRPLVVLTGSMEPTIKTGSVLYYKKVPQEELKVGDPITFKINNQVVSHRINNIINGEYETKGDANDSPDPIKTKYQNILGKDAKITIPYAGYYVWFINQHLYLIIVVIIILISEFLLGNRRTLDIDKNLKEEEVL